MRARSTGSGLSGRLAAGGLGAGMLAIAALAAPAAAGGLPGDGVTVVHPVFASQAGPDGERFVLLELYQPDRDLVNGDPLVNLLVDTDDGRSWILRYGTFPGSNERGYVWVEVPFAGVAPRTN